MPFWSQVVAVAAALMLTTGAAVAEPTEITVRVVSKDAKFVGSSMGGARIVLRDTETGEVLATGVTEGSTGDTEKLVGTRERGKPVSTEDSAKFTAVLELDRPRLIEVTAFGPLAQRQSAVSVSSAQWVVPGKHVTGGDGWLLEMPGLVVDVLDPEVPHPARREFREETQSAACLCLRAMTRALAQKAVYDRRSMPTIRPTATLGSTASPSSSVRPSTPRRLSAAHRHGLAPSPCARCRG